MVYLHIACAVFKIPRCSVGDASLFRDHTPCLFLLPLHFAGLCITWPLPHPLYSFLTCDPLPPLLSHSLLPLPSPPWICLVIIVYLLHFSSNSPLPLFLPFRACWCNTLVMTAHWAGRMRKEERKHGKEGIEREIYYTGNTCMCGHIKERN